MTEKRLLRQVNVRIDDETYERLRIASEIQGHTEGQLCRLLIELALPLYERVRSLDAFKELLKGPRQ